MELSNSEKLKILDFIATCDDFSNGKFLLIDSKINNILKKISASDELYGLIESCLQNYNFEKEFSHAQIKFVGKPARFDVPKEPFRLIPLVFCILVKIEDKSLDLSEFLKSFFVKDETDEFENFSNSVIVPFKNAIASIFDISSTENAFDSNKLYPTEKVEEKKMEKEEMVEDNQLNGYFDEMKKLIDDMLTEIDYCPKLKKDVRENAYILLDAMSDACDMQNLKILNGLIVGFEFIAPSIKNIRFLYKEFKKVLLDLYENLQ